MTSSRAEGKLKIADLGSIHIVSIENGAVRLSGNIADQKIDAWLFPGDYLNLDDIMIELIPM